MKVTKIIYWLKKKMIWHKKTRDGREEKEK
jgi:hypothetical protein